MKFVEVTDVETCETCYGKECRYYSQCQGRNCKYYKSRDELLSLMPYDENEYKSYDEYLEIRDILLGF